MTTNSHPAHGPLSNDRLHRIREILGKAAAQRDGGNLGYAMADAVKAIDELLEVRKAEPVAYIRSAHNPDGFCFADGIHPTHRHQRLPLSTLQDGCYWKVTPLYAAPPAPVVPATLPCAVELKPGLIIGKGCKTETLLTALQRRADYYAEIDAMTPEERAEHDANIEAFKAMLPQPDIEMLSSALRNAPLAPSDSQGRPRAPVVPDEWTVQDAVKFCRETGRQDAGSAMDAWNACRAAMLNRSGDVTREAIKQQSSIHTSNGAMSGDAVKQPSSNASSLVFVDEIAEQNGVDPAITDVYMQGYHDSEGRKSAPVDNDDLREAVSDLLSALDEYPEQLVPINRKSFLVRTIRAAMLNGGNS